MALEPNGSAPYTTAAAAITFLDVFRDRGLAGPFTTDTLIRAGVPETLGRRTHQSLKLLGLIGDDDKATRELEDLRQVRGDEEYKKRLQEWLRGVYADVLQYTDPSTDSPNGVAEAFRTYEPAGQRRAMASLLIGLWKYSGLPVPAESGATTRERTASPRPKATRARTTAKSNPAKPPRAGRFYGGGSVGASLAMDVGLPPGLVGLIQQIPRGGKGWTEQDRDNFLTAFTAVLDFTVPIRPVGLEDLTDADLTNDEVASL
jgi:hypothetical protein